MNAKEYWEEKYGEQKTKEDKLQIALMHEYGDYISRTVEKLGYSEGASQHGAVADITKELRYEFDRMINGYKTVHIGYGIEVANLQFLEKQTVDNYFSNILPGYLEKLLIATASL